MVSQAEAAIVVRDFCGDQSRFYLLNKNNYTRTKHSDLSNAA